ncbi:MAG: antitoxin [Acidimicrobiales bacterium]|nr:MAG: antitoxin [Acidimicrobiales bacterium]
MRTTVTLESDVAALLAKSMKERELSFKQAVNQAVRAGLTSSSEIILVPTRTFRMGFRPAFSLDKALMLAGEMEDEDLTRRQASRK